MPRTDNNTTASVNMLIIPPAPTPPWYGCRHVTWCAAATHGKPEVLIYAWMLKCSIRARMCCIYTIRDWLKRYGLIGALQWAQCTFRFWQWYRHKQRITTKCRKLMRPFHAYYYDIKMKYKQQAFRQFQLHYHKSLSYMQLLSGRWHLRSDLRHYTIFGLPPLIFFKILIRESIIPAVLIVLLICCTVKFWDAFT